jgi:hypothetical protein
MVVFQYLWVFFENGALGRRLHVCLNAQKAILFRLGEQEVQEAQQFEIFLFAWASPEDPGKVLQYVYKTLGRACDDQRAYGRTSEDDELGGLEKNMEIALFKEIACDYVAKDDNYAYYGEHFSLTGGESPKKYFCSYRPEEA